jgi:LuxR family transcriptional regulator, maltose regulon positive regulatory protein
MSARIPSLAKLTAPSLSRVLDRPRLFGLLHRARERPIVWIGGPAGCGKTTLIASYLRKREIRPLWYQLDAGDGDPATFFHYLGLAVRRATPRSRAPLPQLTPELLPTVRVFARRWFDDAFARLPKGTMVVLDDYHEAPVDSALHAVLAVGLDVLPRDKTVVILSRGSPPRELGRLRAERRVSIVDEAALALTMPEFKALARVQLGPKSAAASKAELQQLHRRTGGWVAGSVLLLDRTARRKTTFEGRDQPPEVLFDYLASEVMRALDEDTKTVLLKTSVVPSTSPATACALSGHKRAGEILARLHRGHCFVERRPGADTSYQYHPLFREFLVAEASRRFSMRELARLRLMGARLCESAGLIEDASTLYRDAAAFDALGRLVAANAGRLLREGRAQTVEAWLRDLPPAQVERAPWLTFWRAMCRLTANPLEAQAGFTSAFDRFDRAGDRAGTLLAWCGIVNAIWYAWEDLPALDVWLDRFATVMPEGTAYPSSEIEASVTCAMFNALFWRRTRRAIVWPWADKAIRVLERVPALGAEHAVTAIALMNFFVLVGELNRAERVLGILEAALRLHPAAPVAEAARYQAEGALAAVRGDVDRCLRAATKGLDVAATSGASLWALPLAGVGCLGALSTGDVATAKAYSDRMLAPGLNGALLFRSWTLILAARLALENGDPQAARRAADESLRMTVHEGPFPEVLSRLVAAHAELATRRTVEARAQLAQIEAITRDMACPLLEIGWRLACAELAFAEHREEAGFDELRRAFAMGASSGLMEWQDGMRTASLAQLCAHALRANIEPGYVRALIAKRRLVGDALAGEAWPWPIKVYTLGRFAVLKDGRPIAFKRKAQKRPLDLLKALVALGGRDVSQARVLEALWPDAEGHAAIAAMNMTLKRLRKLLDDADVVTLTGGKLTLDARRCWVDAWTFERALGQTGADTIDGDDPLELYRGPFLGSDDGPWVYSMRERLRTKALARIRRVARERERRQAWAEAADCYERGLAIDDLTEEFYQRLMLCHERLGQRGEAVAAYLRCKRSFAVHQHTLPSQKTERIYAQVTASNAERSGRPIG